MTTEPLERQVEGAWSELADRLTDWLTDVPPDGHVIIELAWPDDDGESGAAPYVQVAIDGLAVRSEAVSNDYLAPRFRLDDPRAEALLDIGWDEPDEPDVCQNYWRADQLPDDAGLVAEALVGALRDVYGVPDPSFLEVSGFDDEAPWTADDLPLGLTVRRPTPPQVDLTALVAESADELRDLVAEVLVAIVGGPVEFDPDGDIPVPAGDGLLYVTVDEETPCVRLWTLLLHDVPWKPRVGFELNRVNTMLRFARVAYRDGTVVLEHDMYSRPFVPEHLRAAVAGVTGLVDGLAAKLQTVIGGRLLSEPADGTP